MLSSRCHLFLFLHEGGQIFLSINFLWYPSLTSAQKQTLLPESKEVSKPSGKPTSYGSVAAAAPAEAPLSARQLINVPALRSLIISGFALSFISFGYDTLFLLFAYTPVQVGGLGFNVRI